MKKLMITTLALLLAMSLFAGTAMAAHSPEKLLSAIHSLAEEGGVLNCDFQVGDCTIEDIRESLGKPDKSNYVASAQGTYETFDNHAIVAGVGKGDLVFELRSFSKRLHVISEHAVTEYFGDHDHIAHEGGQTMVSYVLNHDYHLKFVFNGDGYLDHYNVIYLAGSGNSMAGEHDRNW